MRRTGAAGKIGWLTVLGVAIAMAGAALTVHGQQNVSASLSSADNVPLLGSSVTNMSQLEQNTNEFGHMPIIHTYYQGLPAATAWTASPLSANKSAAVVSFNAQPDAILSGADDAALSHFFDTAPTGHPIYYSYYHEPEDNISRGQFTLAAYKAAWAHIVMLAAQAHNSYLHSTLILMAYDLKPAAHRNWKDYLPTGGIISVLGWDAYPAGFATAVPPSEFMAPAVAASKSVGLPFGFAEFGMSVPAGRSAWLSEVGSYLMTSGALFGTMFDSAAVQPSMKVADASSISIWRGFVQDSADGVDPISPTPAPAPSAPPAGPAVTAPEVSGLTLSPAQFPASGQGQTVIHFRLSHSANVTICMLRSDGSVARDIAEPAEPAGNIQIPFRALASKGVSEPAGTYRILVVASNSVGSSISEQTLTLAAP